MFRHLNAYPKRLYTPLPRLLRMHRAPYPVGPFRIETSDGDAESSVFTFQVGEGYFDPFTDS